QCGRPVRRPATLPPGEGPGVREWQQFEVWLYRGAWEEWEPHEIERAVPLSPCDLERKKNAVFRHQSQKDKAMFPGGADKREFWQRAEDRNRNTAKTYDNLGLPEFYALEGFVQWRDLEDREGRGCGRRAAG